MPLSRVAFLFVAGIVIGWFLRDLTLDEPKDRSGRTLDSHRDNAAGDRNNERTSPRAQPGSTSEEAQAPEAEPAAPANTPPKDNPAEKLVRTMARQWKAMASMLAKQRFDGQLVQAGFDEETAAKIEDLISEEAARQTERAVQMMLGQGEIDPDTFYWFFGVGPEVSEDLERSLGAFLSDGEVEAVRQQMKQNHEKQLAGFADMSMQMMGLKNLGSDQETRVREVLVGNDAMKEMFVGFAELTRNPKKLLHALEDDKALASQFSTMMAPTRNRLRDILTPQQFTQYEAYEKMQVQGFRMQMQMMKGLITPSAKDRPAGN